jgi:ribonuclease D
MHIITAQHELQSVIDAFQKCEFVTVDTEFIRETTYWPQVCLTRWRRPASPR